MRISWTTQTLGELHKEVTSDEVEVTVNSLVALGFDPVVNE